MNCAGPHGGTEYLSLLVREFARFTAGMALANHNLRQQTTIARFPMHAQRSRIRNEARLGNRIIVCGSFRWGQNLTNQVKHRKMPFAICEVSREKVIEANELNSWTRP